MASTMKKLPLPPNHSISTNCNIVCLTGDELKADASAYLQVLFDADPAAVGGALPGDDFYWTAE